jgi:hypothetical protein
LEIGEADAFAAELIQVRCLEDGIPVRAEIPVTLVIREDEDDIGSIGGHDDGDEQGE